MLVERAEADGKGIKTHLLMGLKSNEPGIRFEEALAQVVKEIQQNI